MSFSYINLRTETEQDAKDALATLAQLPEGIQVVALAPDEEGEEQWLTSSGNHALFIAGPRVVTPGTYDEAGQELTAPVMDNRFHAVLAVETRIEPAVRQALAAVSEDYSVAVDVPVGLEIAGRVSSSSDPLDYPLSALEFTAALIRMGVDPNDVEPAIRQLFAGDLDQMADAVASWRNLKTMTYDNPTMDLLKPVFSISAAQIEAAWMATVARRA